MEVCCLKLQTAIKQESAKADVLKPKQISISVRMQTAFKQDRERLNIAPAAARGTANKKRM
jgi:hypothetical protein